jgi:sortase (surface protein transpeptidase)
VSRRATAALVAELALGAGVVAAGLLALAASGPDPAAAPAATGSPTSTESPSPPTFTVPPTTVATTDATTTTTTTTEAVVAVTTVAPASSEPASTAVEGAPVVTHRATVDVLAPRPVAAPVRVAIPALGVDGPVLPAGVNAQNELDVPPDALSLVWYRHGPVPGARGSAVIAGHLNWDGVTGLFADLATTPVGAEVAVGFADGSQRSFRVTTVELVPKPAVSVNGVFARDGEHVLRLVTCGGEFDDAVNSYRSNVVVTAVPI